MTTSNQMATALLTEHFRYTPLTLLDDIINTVNELVFRAVNAVEEGLNNATPESLGFKTPNRDASPQAQQDAIQEAKQLEIDKGIVQLESLLNATVDKDFDKFEIYTLRNILAVGHEEEQLAGWVQLEHYKNVDVSKVENSPTPEQVQLQRRKLHESTKLNAMLKAEEARNAAVLEQLRTLVGKDGKTDLSESPFAFLTTGQRDGKVVGGQMLDQNVQYALSQLPALRQHLDQLKQSLQMLPNARIRDASETEAQVDRRQYLEQQSRKALERRGVETRDGAASAVGGMRKIGREEVEGMEAVVQAMGGAQARISQDHDEMEE